MKRILKFRIYSGKEDAGTLLDRRYAGNVYFNETDEYYVIRLKMFPRSKYYMKKNADSSTHYTVFAGRLGQGDLFRFLDPVGDGALKPDLRNYLKIKFDLIGPVFMNLFPVETRETDSATPREGEPQCISA